VNLTFVVEDTSQAVFTPAEAAHAKDYGVVSIFLIMSVCFGLVAFDVIKICDAAAKGFRTIRQFIKHMK
jgi:hypothetical protein